MIKDPRSLLGTSPSFFLIGKLKTQPNIQKKQPSKCSHLGPPQFGCCFVGFRYQKTIIGASKTTPELGAGGFFFVFPGVPKPTVFKVFNGTTIVFLRDLNKKNRSTFVLMVLEDQGFLSLSSM